VNAGGRNERSALFPADLARSVFVAAYETMGGGKPGTMIGHADRTRVATNRTLTDSHHE
jgi:hypothetical protein